MAISATHYALLKELHSQGVLPQGGRILEIGQANWYGDAQPSVIAEGLNGHPDRPEIEARIAGLGQTHAHDLFYIARLAYHALFNPTAVTAIDLHSPGDALKLDLVKPINLRQQFDVVFNHGTMEHPSQDLETQETIHRHCKVGGLIIHEAPYNQPEHGQRAYQFNFFTGMAKANGYEIVLAALEHLESKTYFRVESPAQIQEMHRRRQLPHDLMLFVCMRKTTDAPYVSNWMQDVYSGECEPGRVLLVR